MSQDINADAEKKVAITDDNETQAPIFADLKLSDPINRALTEAGYHIPTPIQAQAIPIILSGMDVTGIAQTGTGKTGAFVLPMIEQLSTGRARARMSRCLILAPTRELAAQVADSFEKYGKHLSLNMALLIGGVSFKEQEQKLLRGVDVLIATPGRLIDQFERGKLLLNGVETLIIDEADRMLDMGFVPDIEKICALLPPKRQTLLFSATMPKEIAHLAEKFQKIPITIEVSRPAQTADTIKQFVVPISVNSDKARRTALRRVIEACEVDNGIVFCNRKRTVDIVAKSLVKHGMNAAPIHGDLSQIQRMETLESFRAGRLKILVASDVAARGLDIPEVSHVFNYAPPPKDEDYVHRIGRTGRAGKTGQSYTIVTGEYDCKAWDSVLKLINQDVESFTLPGLDAELEALPSDKSRGNSRRGSRSDRSGDRVRNRTKERNVNPANTSRNATFSNNDDTDRRETPNDRSDTYGQRHSNERVVGFGNNPPDFFNIDLKVS